MTDIHCHLLYGLDDGAQSIEDSKKMLDCAGKQNITDIILTPHWRRGMFRYDLERADRHFSELKDYAVQTGINIYPGAEYHVDKDIIDSIKNGKVHTLADGKYVLTEYSHDSEFSYIKWMTRELMYNGYIPVIAHVERYLCMTDDFGNMDELKNMGALIQVNADSVAGIDGRTLKKLCKQMIKEELIDVIASDCHNTGARACHMAECYKYLNKEFDEATAVKLMQDNPSKILVHC